MHPHTAHVLAEARIDDLRREANRSPNPPQFTSFVLATADAQAVWDRASGFLEKGPDSDLYQTFDFHPVWTGDKIEIGDVSVSFTEMDHPVRTVGSRWEASNRTLFFTGDTGPAGDWREQARGVDVLLCEASYQGAVQDKEYAQHLTAGEAGQIARDVGAKKLVLTHIPPYLDPSRSVHETELTFDRPVALAVPGNSFDV